MAHYIVSTASAPMQYCVYAPGKNNNPKIVRKIRIDGYANTVNPGTLAMHRCAITEVSDQDWEELQKNSGFMEAVKNGFMTHSEVNDMKIVEDMKKRDNSAQIQDWEFADGKDDRFTIDSGMGMSKAAAGLGDGIKGKKGILFVE